MAQVPRKVSIHDQLVELLRQGIVATRWRRELPSEAELCREFQVSRMTLRKALAQLSEERWIELGGRGKAHRIRPRPRKREMATARTIRVLTPFTTSQAGSVTHSIFVALNEHVSMGGYRVETEHHPSVFETFQPTKLARLDALPDTAAWVLFFANEPMQSWFAGCGRPTVVAGRIPSGVSLSCIYPDTEAVARHAVGLLYARGHREMVYFLSTLTSLSDRVASEVFLAEATRLGTRARIVSYDGGAEEAGKVMRELLASRPRPTGYVIAAPEIAVTILCHLQAAGLRVPADASVIALWGDHQLNCTYPTIARYHVDGVAFGRQLGRLLMDLVHHGPGKVRSIPVMPEFVSGGSVGPLGM